MQIDNMVYYRQTNIQTDWPLVGVGGGSGLLTGLSDSSNSSIAPALREEQQVLMYMW